MAGETTTNEPLLENVGKPASSDSFVPTPGKNLAKRNLILALLAIVSFALNYYLELRFDHLKVLDQYNVLFDADPNEAMAALVDASQGRGYKHPDFAYFLHPPIRYAAKALFKSHLTTQNEVYLRRQLALLVIPLSGAAKTIVLFLFFLELGASMPVSLLLCAIDLVSLSRLVFGSIPESFPISGFSIAVLYLLAINAMKPGRYMRKVFWVIAGTFAIGITITNMIPMAVLLFSIAAQKKEKLFDAMRGTLIPTAVAVVSAVCIAIGIGAVTHSGIEQLHDSYTGDSFYRNKVLETLSSSPAALTHTFLAPRPGIMPDEWPGWNFRYPLQFTYSQSALEPAKEIVFEIFALSLMALGCLAHWTHSGTRGRFLLLASLSLLLSNLLLHCLYGSKDLFLYSLHWSLPALFVLSGLAWYKNPALRSLLVIFFCMLAVNNFFQLSYIFGYLGSY